jgi:hypothetical protein
MSQVEAESAVRLGEWLTILAILFAPLVAIQVERYIARFKERQRRKLDVFHALMATRGVAARASILPRHVEALNRIDLEFYGDQRVLRAWRTYHDHLCTPNPDQNRWTDTGTDLFNDMLSTMAVTLGYDFDPVVLKKGGYYPQGYGDIDADQLAIRKALRGILEGNQPLKVTVDSQPPNGTSKPTSSSFTVIPGPRM